MNKLTTLVAAALSVAPIAAQADSDKPLAIGTADPGLEWSPCPPIFSGDCSIAVLHGDPARPGADIFLRVGGGTTLPPHRHTSAERMILVAGRMRVDYRGAPPATLEPGDYAYGPAGLPHSASCIGDRPCTLFIAFDGPIDALPYADHVD